MMTTKHIMIMAAGVLGAGTLGLATGGLLLLWLFNRSESKANYATVAVERREPVPKRVAPAVMDRVEQRDSEPERVLPPPLPVQSQRPASTRAVLINGQRLTDQQLQSIEQRYPSRIPDGRYWYDRVSGAWGLEGGPCAGFVLPGQTIGGELRADASGGNTGVFINGRQLHMLDVMGLQQFMPVRQGRYWVDSQGNFGYEGGPYAGNLVQIIAASGRAGGGGGKSGGDYGAVIGDGSGFIGFIDHEGRSASFQH